MVKKGILYYAAAAMIVALCVGTLIAEEGLSADKKEASAAPANIRVRREMHIDLGDGVVIEMIRVEPGEFDMGSPAGEKHRADDEAQHNVRITKPFYLGKYEVTQAVWRRVMEADLPQYKSTMPDVVSYPSANPSKFSGANRPVDSISFRDCREFLNRLNLLVPGGGFGLPTEAQWEYACRAGTTTAFSFGDGTDDFDIWDYAWFKDNSGGMSHDVGLKKPNRWGFYDMHGNVWEWCRDKYVPEYEFTEGETVTDPLKPPQDSDWVDVIRGGSWFFDAPFLRCANRCGFDPWHRDEDNGLRLCRTIK